MKKKLFAFALACVALGSSSYGLRANAGYAELSALNAFDSTGDSVWITKVSSFNQLLNQGVSAIDKVCGDYDQLLSRLEVANRANAADDDCKTATTHDSPPVEPVMSVRPPELKKPIDILLERNEEVDQAVTYWIRALDKAYQDGIMERFQTSAIEHVPPLLDAAFGAKPYLATLASIMMARTLRSEEPGQVESIVAAVDPIRSRSLLEEYQSYDLTFQDRLWIQRVHHQHQSQESTSEDIEILDDFIAASEALCSPAKVANVTPVVDKVEIASHRQPSPIKSYFVRKIPIDFALSPAEPSIRNTALEVAIKSQSPQLVNHNDEELRSLFGVNVIPFVDFSQSNLAWTIKNPPHVLRLRNVPLQGNFEMVSKSFITSMSSSVEQTLADDSKPAWNWRSVASKSVQAAKYSLGQMQSWLDNLEVALADEGSATKVASKYKFNQTQE